MDSINQERFGPVDVSTVVETVTEDGYKTFCKMSSCKEDKQRAGWETVGARKLL